MRLRVAAALFVALLQHHSKWQQMVICMQQPAAALLRIGLDTVLVLSPMAALITSTSIVLQDMMVLCDGMVVWCDAPQQSNT
jgi:hypothetical protein